LAMTAGAQRAWVREREHRKLENSGPGLAGRITDG
jgi:hypothetical protein